MPINSSLVECECPFRQLGYHRIKLTDKNHYESGTALIEVYNRIRVRSVEPKTVIRSNQAVQMTITTIDDLPPELDA